jgi:hypothetical protein
MFNIAKTYRDEELYGILDQIRKLFNSEEKESNFKKIAEENNIHDTVWALIMLSYRINRLCESVLSCKEYYASAIIYRSLIEHFFKRLYILLSCVETGDDIAKDYTSSEHILSEMLKRIHKAQWPLPELAEELQKLKKKTKETAGKFLFDKVSKSILEILPKIFPKDDVTDMLRSIMVKYSILSSYVHAGPMAVLDVKEKRKKDIDMGCMVLTIIAYNDTVRLLSVYPSEHQNKLKVLAKEMHEKVGKALAIYKKWFVS